VSLQATTCSVLCKIGLQQAMHVFGLGAMTFRLAERPASKPHQIDTLIKFQGKSGVPSCLSFGTLVIPCFVEESVKRRCVIFSRRDAEKLFLRTDLGRFKCDPRMSGIVVFLKFIFLAI
jgi:hypothetical protein